MNYVWLANLSGFRFIQFSDLSSFKLVFKFSDLYPVFDLSSFKLVFKFSDLSSF